MTIATTSDQNDIQSSIRSWAKSADPIATVRKQENEIQAWREQWPALAELGLFGVAVAEEHGGAGAEIVDLAVMLEQTAAQMVPGPILSTAAAGVLVSKAGGPVADALGEKIAEGQMPVGIVLGMDTAPLVLNSGTVTGEAGIALGGVEGEAVLVPLERDGSTVWAIIDGDTQGLHQSAVQTYDIASCLTRVELNNVSVDNDRILGSLSADDVRNLVVSLAAAEAAGITAYTLTTSVEYAKVREQFGKTIGSFQSIKHLCANMLCRTEQARAVAWDAAVAAEDIGQDGSELDIAAAAAGAMVFDLAVTNTQDCIQILGGIGFTFEHDAHFYMRKAAALRQFVGGSSHWRRVLAQYTLEGRRRHLNIDLSEIEGIEAKREEVRNRVAKVAKLEGDDRKRALADSGLFMPHLPEPWGMAASAPEQLMVDEELAAAGVERHNINIGSWAVPTILDAAPEHTDQFVRATMAGDLKWCQLFSEPGAGSDLAALRGTAEKVDGGWKLNGQKVWTSLAREADWAMCLARTDKDAPKHKGITYFLVDMKSEGIRCAPLREITGEALFNEVFLEDVFVPDAYQIGAVNEGWKIARTTLANERVAMGGGSSLGDAVEDILKLIHSAKREEDGVTLDELGRHISEALAGSVLELRTALRSISGQGPGPESAVRKIVGVRHRQDVAEFGLDLTGVGGTAFTEEGRVFLMVRCLSIAGGTEQVLLNVAGERILGLPRD